MKSINIALFVTLLLTYSQIVVAYVGPGAGLSLIGSLIAVLVAILMALGIILFWPIRALIRKIRGKKGQQPDTLPASTDKEDS